MAGRVLQYVTKVLGAALILLAFSEFIFVNEEPVAMVVAAESFGAALAALAELTAFYLLPGLALVALEPLITSWSRALLAGAFVGWSIEAAMVPAAYEAVPLSYLWTSVSWHAVIDVAFGYLAYRMAMRARWPVALGVTVAFGATWAVWSTWVWDEMPIGLAEFINLAAVIVVLLTVGYWLADREPDAGPPSTLALWAAVLINGAAWAINAIGFPLQALGLLVLAVVTGLALWRAPKGRGGLIHMRPRFAAYGWPILAGAVATAFYAVFVETGPPIPPDELVWPIFGGGGLWFLWAMIRGLWGRAVKGP